jgi:hypothetical protein
VESFARTEREIASEVAATLARIARTLEDLLAQLHQVRATLATGPPDERVQARARYQDLRRRALLYRWYLIVQREAVGLFRHADVDQYYPIPPSLR